MIRASRIAALRAWAIDVERAWLGWSFAPPERVLASVAWRPDVPQAYCGRCGASVGPGEVTVTGCGACRGNPVAHDGMVRLGAYAGPMIQWVRAIKYQGWGEMAETLGALLGRSLAARLGAPRGMRADQALLVPMPMPWQRRIYRGIDHAALIATAAAEVLGAACRSLLVAENGPPQVSMPRALRSARLAGMRLGRRVSGCSLEGLDVVLIDDVRTSGASLGAATRILRGLGPRRLFAAVLAVAEPFRRRALTPPPGGGRPGSGISPI